MAVTKFRVLVRALATLVLGTLLTDPAFSRELLPILYSSSGELCSVARDSSGAAVCAPSHGAYDVDSPSWQPNGRQIISEQGREGGVHKLWLLDSNGHRLKSLAGSEGYMRPLWTPDGKRVIALRYGLGRAVGQWTADGSKRVTIPLVGFADRYHHLQFIAVSRSGKRTAIIVDDFKKMLLADVSDDQWTVTGMVPEDFAYVSGPVWRDDEHLVFAGSRVSQQPKGLWILDTTAGLVSAVPAGSLSIRDFVSMAPDVTALVVCAYGGGELKWSLWSVDLGSGEIQRLTFGIEDVTPSWGSPPQ
jgi:Tol biopolymer transport system component